MDPPPPMLSLDEVTVLQRRKQSLLVGPISLSVEAGDIVAIVGESGIGKSSLLNVIAGFIPSEAGSARSPWHWFDQADTLWYRGAVSISGRSIDSSPPEARRAIGMVMQGGVVYDHLSVLRNVTFPMRMAGARDPAALRAEASRLLDTVELFDKESERTRLGDKAGTLSGGERQRLALARALAKKPSVFLLDEAFANLDPVLRADLFNKFTALIHGHPRCAMVVTHDLSDLAQVQRVLLLGPGRDGPGYCSYRRVGDSLAVEEDRSDGSEYWSIWDRRIIAASATPA